MILLEKPMSTDTTERGLENIIERDMLALGWKKGKPSDYNRDFAVDLAQLKNFIEDTQKDLIDAFDINNDSPTRQKFLARLQGEVTKRGVIDVLKNGIKHGAYHLDLYYASPSTGNAKAIELHAKNRFSLTRQLCYSNDATKLALDMAIFINGLPFATLELKNSLTKQTVDDAVWQYRKDRDPRELIFQFGRCAVHFAIDDTQVMFCTNLSGKSSWFLPFNKGYKDDAGNPPNPNGLKTDYLWKEILSTPSLCNILENFAQIVEVKDEKTGRKKRTQIWPRYHQLDVVREILLDVAKYGIGKRYLIQHSAGSGKSNSIGWLAHQLIELQKDEKKIFDSVIVITDRRILDKQTRDTIKGFAGVGSIVGHAERSGDLRRFIESGKKIIISTIQKFPYIMDEIEDNASRQFAIIIDEAHSSQGGRNSQALSASLSSDPEDDINDALQKRMNARKMLTNASYFAFTATPKEKTLQMFGIGYEEAGEKKFKAFHNYTMKQAVQEGFILDVLKYYTPVNSYYKLIKTVQSDPEFDTKRAKKKLRRYVESHEHAIRLKAEIMIDHFHEQVIGLRKIGGDARAMVVTNGIDRAIEYFHAFNNYLKERKSPYKAIVAFSGEQEYGGVKVTEASLNEFSSNDIPNRIQEDPYRFLICADKFQTGYDEPLLHTMYVDKTLSGIKAVQTLSRLNRAHPKKHDAFVLDFLNDEETIKASFSPFYRGTILSGETDPNKLHDLKATLDDVMVYSDAQIDQLVKMYLEGESREKLDPILDVCVAVYNDDLSEDEQVAFKGNAKAFNRTYSFLASILPYTNAQWEKLSIFMNFLIPKLPSPVEDDLSKGILETIDMDSYRVEKKAVIQIQLPDEDGMIEPAAVGGGSGKPEPELDRLSNILKIFNDQFGNIPWSDSDRVHKLITEDIPARVAADASYQNAIKNTPHTARIESDKALARVMVSVLKDDTELFKQFSDNPEFKRWMQGMIYGLTSNTGAKAEV